VLASNTRYDAVCGALLRAERAVFLQKCRSQRRKPQTHTSGGIMSAQADSLKAVITTLLFSPAHDPVYSNSQFSSCFL
jgi:hypothetical protein